MSHTVGDDFSLVIERALDLLIDKLEREKLGKRSRQPAPARNAAPRRAATATASATAATATATAAPESERPFADQPAHVKNDSRKWVDPKIAPRTKWAAFQRDQGQCTFTDARGNRCPSRTWLEFDHIRPQARGGSGELENVRLLCKHHNRQEACRIFGAQHVKREIVASRQAQAAKRRADG